MARMLGRYQVPGCCPGTRAGMPPGPDCSGGGTRRARDARRIEGRQLARDIADEVACWQCGTRYDSTDSNDGCDACDA